MGHAIVHAAAHFLWPPVCTINVRRECIDITSTSRCVADDDEAYCTHMYFTEHRVLMSVGTHPQARTSIKAAGTLRRCRLNAVRYFGGRQYKLPLAPAPSCMRSWVCGSYTHDYIYRVWLDLLCILMYTNGLYM